VNTAEQNRIFLVTVPPRSKLLSVAPVNAGFSLKMRMCNRRAATVDHFARAV